MTTATLELYNALVDAGVSKEKAEAAATVVITRQEARDTLASKDDIALVKDDISNLRSEMYRAMMIQTGVTISAVGVLIALFSLIG